MIDGAAWIVTARNPASWRHEQWRRPRLVDGASLEVNFLDSMDLYAPAGKSPVHGSDRYLSCVRKHPEKPVRLNKPPDTTNLRNLYDQL